MKTNQQPKRPRGRPPGTKGGGRPTTGRTESFPGLRVLPGTADKFRAAAKSLNISLAETVEAAAEKIMRESQK